MSTSHYAMGPTLERARSQTNKLWWSNDLGVAVRQAQAHALQTGCQHHVWYVAGAKADLKYSTKETA